MKTIQLQVVRSQFTWGEGFGPYPGYHVPEIRWNGWCVPYFNRHTTQKIIKDSNTQNALYQEDFANGFSVMRFSNNAVQVIHPFELDEAGEPVIDIVPRLKAETFQLGATSWPLDISSEEFYGLGGYLWTWYEVPLITP